MRLHRSSVCNRWLRNGNCHSQVVAGKELESGKPFIFGTFPSAAQGPFCVQCPKKELTLSVTNVTLTASLGSAEVNTRVRSFPAQFSLSNVVHFKTGGGTLSPSVDSLFETFGRLLALPSWVGFCAPDRQERRARFCFGPGCHGGSAWRQYVRGEYMVLHRGSHPQSKQTSQSASFSCVLLRSSPASLHANAGRSPSVRICVPTHGTSSSSCRGSRSAASCSFRAEA